MDERLHLFWWALSGGAILGTSGSVFGGLVGALTYLDGRAAGGYIGLSVARAMDRVSERPLAPATLAVLVGAVDGGVFLGIIGLIVGVCLGGWLDVSVQWGLWLALGVVGLVLTAAVLGSLAYGLAWIGPRVVALLGLGGIAGAFLGARFGGLHGTLLGLLLGAALGIGLTLLQGPRRHDP